MKHLIVESPYRLSLTGREAISMIRVVIRRSLTKCNWKPDMPLQSPNNPFSVVVQEIKAYLKKAKKNKDLTVRSRFAKPASEDQLVVAEKGRGLALPGSLKDLLRTANGFAFSAEVSAENYDYLIESLEHKFLSCEQIAKHGNNFDQLWHDDDYEGLNMLEETFEARKNFVIVDKPFEESCRGLVLSPDDEDPGVEYYAYDGDLDDLGVGLLEYLRGSFEKLKRLGTRLEEEQRLVAANPELSNLERFLVRQYGETGYGDLRELKFREDSTIDLEVPAGLDSLESFRLKARSLRRLSGLTQLGVLREIHLEWLPLPRGEDLLEVVTGLETLTSLSSLRVVSERIERSSRFDDYGCGPDGVKESWAACKVNLERLQGLDQLEQLELVCHRAAYENISMLAHLPHLRVLVLEGNGYFDLSILNSCQALEEVTLAQFEKVVGLPLLTLPKLRSLRLKSHHSIETETEMDFSNRLPNLTELTISGWRSGQYNACEFTDLSEPMKTIVVRTTLTYPLEITSTQLLEKPNVRTVDGEECSVYFEKPNNWETMSIGPSGALESTAEAMRLGSAHYRSGRDSDSDPDN